MNKGRQETTFLVIDECCIVMSSIQIFFDIFLKLTCGQFPVVSMPSVFGHLQKKLHEVCTYNPISPQGMLIFGYITSLFAGTFYHKNISVISVDGNDTDTGLPYSLAG